MTRGKLVYQFPDAVWPNSTLKNDFNIPAPPIIRGLVLEPCVEGQANQTFTYNNSERLIHFHDPVGYSACFTYGGYHEANFGLGECKGWVSPGVGGQQ